MHNIAKGRELYGKGLAGLEQCRYSELLEEKKRKLRKRKYKVDRN